jgi:hypothetical protein
MHPHIIPLTLNVVILGVALFAYREGALAERLGGVWLGCNTVVGAALLLLDLDSPLSHLIADGVFATGLLPLAVIFASYWIGLVTLAAAALFSLEAIYLIYELPMDQTFAQINNVLVLSVPLVMLCSGVVNRWRRKRRERAERRAGVAIAAAAAA